MVLALALAMAEDAYGFLPGFKNMHDLEKIQQAVATAEQRLGISPGYSVMHRHRFITTLECLRRVVPMGKQLRVIDVGVWPGYQSVALHECGYRVTGIDLHPGRLGSLPFPIQAQDLNVEPMLRVEPETFDAIVATEIIEHLDPARISDVLVGSQRALVPGGWLLMTTPNRHYLGSFGRSRVHGTDADGHGHTREYTIAEIRAMFGPGWGRVSVRTIDAYRGVGIISTREYYRPLWQWWRHPRRLHNLVKFGLGLIQRICPAVRDTIVVLAQRPKIDSRQSTSPK